MKANIIIKDTPVIISGFNIGIYVMFIIIVLGVFFIEYMPIAAAVPSIVAITDDISASKRVFTKDDIINSFWNSFAYQSNVNPVQTDWLFDLLNENTISIKIGIYKSSKTVAR